MCSRTAGASALVCLAASLALALAATATCRGPATPRPLTDNGPPSGYPRGALVAVAPKESPLTEARAQLGRRLFYDKRLSRTGAIACATCHRQEHAFSDPVAVSMGVDGRTGTRNARALVNLAWSSSFFGDGRVTSLEQLVSQPIENPVEMGVPLADAVAFVNGDSTYVREFQAAFDDAPPSAETLRQALASFVRTLVSGSSPYDRHLRGDNADFGPAALRGEALFFGEGGMFPMPSGRTADQRRLFQQRYIRGRRRSRPSSGHRLDRRSRQVQSPDASQRCG